MTRIGIDIGGTKTQGVILDEGGRVLRSVRSATGHGSAGVLASAVGAVEALTSDGGLGALESIGVGVPGSVDVATGRVENAVNLDVAGLDLGARLLAGFGVPVHVENDVNAAAVGIYHLLELDGRAPRSLAYLNFGTGLAAGIVVDGAVWRGAGGAAGEIGHIPVDPGGELCVCGQRGCLETLASGSALARRWPGRGGAPVASLLDAVDVGDVEARAVFADFVRAAAAAVRLLALTVAPERVVIGGGVSAAGQRLLDPIRDALDELGREVPFLAALGLSDRIELEPAGQPAAAIGAALGGAGGKELTWQR